MNVSKELLEKAKTANSAEELLAMAKAENLNLTEEEASKAFVEFNKTGELSDEELDNVSGGCGGTGTDPGWVTEASQVVFLFSEWQIVYWHYGPNSNKYIATVTKLICYHENGWFRPKYEVVRLCDGKSFCVGQDELTIIDD